MSKQINVEEVLAKQGREGRANRYLSYEVHSVQAAWENDEKKSEYLSDFVVIRLATLLENAARGTVQHLVDHGAPYTANGVKLLAKGSIKDAAALLLAIHEEQLSLGSLVAHSISTNNVSGIINSLDAVVGEDIKTKLLSVRDSWRAEVEKKPDEPIIKNLSETISTVERVLKTRHIVVHELPQKRPYQRDEVSAFIQEIKNFLLALELVVSGMLYGKVRMTQTDINIRSYEQAKEVGYELGVLLQKIEKHIDDDEIMAHFKKTQATWEEFVSMQAEQRAGRVGQWKHNPGTIAPLRCNIEYLNRRQERLDDLKLYYDEEGRPRP